MISAESSLVSYKHKTGTQSVNIKTILISPILLAFLSFSGCGGESSSSKKLKDQTVDSSCGLCQFGQTQQKGCLINVKLDGKPYPVVGGPKLSMAEMHQPGGYCVAIRKAKVSGHLDGDRFMVSSWELLPLEEGLAPLPAAHD